ncbi:YbgA family protein [Halalkalibacter krulwichiae]|uniref:DUF1722 domain-containing protein n=1 Tax=Halalkalibacter krulwichiae TaxID=199441 RepID=A0A1X9MAB4_9BACI|nr:DUF523 and DUF1722 domain-containing protein [Halalkalibacter krulwichiae]ARK30399.1 hypothetical protein BkAM31D_11485 [Halalkalibacter krulwichiae]
MRVFATPKVIVSKCMEFEACRYNGGKINEALIAKLGEYVDFIPVCPEVEIGLETPREAIRLVTDGEATQLIQPKSQLNLTEQMKGFAQEFLANRKEVDGFVLKSRSPSCAITDAKVYANVEKSPVIRTGSGMFTERVLALFPFLPIEDEGRLKNFILREHFFTHLFTVADFRIVKQSRKINELINFHAKNKYLFMACNQEKVRELGRVIGNHSGEQMERVFQVYEKGLYELFSIPIKATSHINVCQHVFGYFSKYLTIAERTHFIQLLEQYREKKIPLSSLIGILRSWCYRFENKYLLNQTYFEPYPEGLIAISDSGKGRAFS